MKKKNQEIKTWKATVRKAMTGKAIVRKAASRKATEHTELHMAQLACPAKQTHCRCGLSCFAVHLILVRCVIRKYSDLHGATGGVLVSTFAFLANAYHPY